MANNAGRNWDPDLRNWMEAAEEVGALQTITGAEPTEEIGGILDLFQRRMGNSAILFDDVPGFPKGHRVLANVLTPDAMISVSNRRCSIGMPLT